MQLIDTHTHLYVEAFDEDRDAVIGNALAAGVDHFFLPSIDRSYTDRMLTLQEQFPNNIHLMMGLHPTHVKENYLEELAHVELMLQKHPFCAVGEIGIDLYWDTSKIRKQQAAFDQQIKWAKIFDLPIVIHCRDAFEEVFEVLEANKGGKLRGIFHCFTGTYQDALRAMDYNLKLGIGGVVTFKNGKIDQFLKQLPLEAIVLETDAPYLAPTPYRGKRNESGYLPLIAQKVSDIYAVSYETVVKQTSSNALEVFNLLE